MESSLLIITVILFGSIFVFLLTGMWIGCALAVVGYIGLMVFLGGKDIVLAAVTYNMLASYTFAAAPLFIFMGQVILHGGLNAKLYSGASKVVSIMPGGLVQSNILSCSIFAAVSGSSVATAATIGSVAYPEQKARGYDDRIILGSLAAGGTLGILIPPSVTMILYGGFVQESVGRLFMGGVIPGVITAVLFASYIGVVALIKPRMFPYREKITRKYFLNAVLAFRDMWPILLIIVFIMGSLYGGLATATESAAVASFGALVLTAAHGRMSVDLLKKSTMETIKISGMVGLILVGAGILASAVSFLKIPAAITAAVTSAALTPMMVWVLVAILYVFLGCFMDGTSMVLLTLPITYPVVVGLLGFNSVWFGVVVVMLVEIGLITPPVGINLFVLQGVTGQKNLNNLIVGSIPFVFVLLASIVLMTLFPELVLYLPNKMFAPRW
jgi:tripartite ATP-independent transporter DctM subunit